MVMQLSTWVALGALAFACDRPHPAAAGPTETFRSRGRIERVSKQELDIHHERIPSIRKYDGTLGPMDSMTMAFATSASAPSAGLAAGDLVQFEFSVHYDAPPTLRLASIAKLPPDTKLELH